QHGRLIRAGWSGRILIDDDFSFALSPHARGQSQCHRRDTPQPTNLHAHLRITGIRRATHYCFLPDKRPISRSKKRAESTSTATLELGTYFSRITGDVRVPESVGAEPRIRISAAACFSISGLRWRSPEKGLYPSVSPAVNSPAVSTST